jgi:hypothetical protein
MNDQFEVPVAALAGSGKWGNRTEFAPLDDGTAAQRRPQGNVLIRPPAELPAFPGGAKDGEFDDLVR